MKNNQTLYAAGLLGILALLYYFTQTGEVDTKSIDTDMFLINRDAIVEVELIHQDVSLLITKEETGWTLENYPVDTLRMTRFLELFSELIPDRLITKNPEKHENYEVTVEGIRFLAKSDDSKELLNLIIGKQGANYQETFVRDMSSDEVYAVKSSLSQYKNMTQKDFWDRSMAKIDGSQINEVAFSGEVDYILKRDGADWMYNGEPVDYKKVTDMLSPLENMNASNFADKIGPENSLYQDIRVGFVDGSTLDLTFYLKDAKGALLLVKVSGNDKIFEYSKSGLNRYKKELSDLIADPKPDA